MALAVTALVRWVIGLTLVHAQIYRLRDVPVPERKSLSMIYTFYVSDGVTPEKTKTPPYVKYQNLQLTSTSGTQSDASLKNYNGVELHLIKFEDSWLPLDAQRMCATQDDYAQGLSTAVDHLIIHKEAEGGTSAYGHQLRFSKMDPDQEMIIKNPGIYFLVLSNCGNFDQAVVNGDVIVKNSHGYLPANEYGKMPFYATMTACVVIIFLIWALLCVRWWKVLFNVHIAIGVVAFVCILESIGWFTYLFSWNEGGLESKQLFRIAAFLSVSRSMLSYMLVLSVCLGWGVTKPQLDGGTICRMTCLSVVYIALNVVREVVLADRHTESVPGPFVFLCLFPVSLMNGGIFYWIFDSLSNLMETLEAQGQSAKLALFQQLWWTLLVAACFAFSLLLARIFMADSAWQYQWLVTDCGPESGFLLVLLCVMYLWCPNEDTQRFAFSEQLDAERAETIETAEVDEKEGADFLAARS